MHFRTQVLYAVAASLLLAGCSTAPTSPVGGRGWSTEAAPALRQIQVRYTAEALVVTGTVDGWNAPRFSCDRAGGWCFQLFLDTDEAPTGYGRGYDYLVRAVEVTPDGNVHVRRTEGGTGPGGWGESVGMVQLATEQKLVSFTVPLALLDDDGKSNFVIELYQTLGKEDGGVWHEFVVGYEGESVSVNGTNDRIRLRREALTNAASRID